jgi:hypothetical protein
VIGILSLLLHRQHGTRKEKSPKKKQPQKKGGGSSYRISLNDPVVMTLELIRGLDLLPQPQALPLATCLLT